MKIIRRLKKYKTKNLKLMKNRINRYKNNPKIKQDTIIERQHFLYCTVEDFIKKYPKYDLKKYCSKDLYMSYKLGESKSLMDDLSLLVTNDSMTPLTFERFIKEELKIPQIALDVLLFNSWLESYKI